MKKFMSRGWFTCVFVCLSCFLISEKLLAEVNGGDEVRTVTLNMWNVSLKEILTEIEKQAGVTFSYESSLLKEFQKTSFKVNDAALDDCLARLFAGYPFVYKRTGNIVVLKRKPRQVTISGFVRDKTSAESLVGKYSINSLVYWVTYVHNVVYSFYRSMIYCYINSTQRCAGSIVIDIIPTNGADKRKFFPFAPYFPVTNVIKRYFYPYFPAIIGIKGYSFPYFPYLSGIMKIKTALYSLFSRLDWHKTVVFPCLGEIYEGIRSLSWEIPVT